MKKFLTLTLALALCAGMMVPASAAKTVLSTQSLRVDGQLVTCEKYNIDGSNYFKLRDLAAALQATGSQFGVGYDAASNSVAITTHADYIANGSELQAGSDKSATAQPSAQSILIDGKAVSDISVYNIGGNNYFKLRDLGEKLGFEVGYDEATRTAAVESAFDEKSVFTYDAAGNTLTETHYYSGDSAPYTITCTYDADGNVLTYSMSGFSSVYTYDDHGSCVKEVSVGEDGQQAVSSYEYTYDNAGNVSKKICHEYDSEDCTFTYTYDAAGNILTQNYVSGDFSQSVTCTYNADNSVKTEFSKDSMGYTVSTAYTYDARGNMIGVSHDFSDGSSSRLTTVFDSHDNEISFEAVYSDGTSFSRTTENTYDAAGNLIKFVSMDSNLQSTITICTYDAQGRVLTLKTSESFG